MITKKNIYIDIDDTICYMKDEDKKIKPLDYSKSVPDERRIDILNKLYDNNNIITMWTARGSLTGIDWYDITKKQLDDWGVKYHKLVMGKPYYDLFIDDKTMTTLEQVDLINKICK